jgi:HD superfamily phosphohydrolase
VADKIFRDPLYDYISIERPSDDWLVGLLDCPEVQRLRRIHQLGVSNFTYPGADHTRLAHSLGVLHLMQLALGRLKKLGEDEHIRQARAALLAAALVHDVGHGPFSHLFEPCLGIEHESWTRRVILSEETEVHRVLCRVNRNLPQDVADLIDPNNRDLPRWQKSLLSSQLDVDRLDYLRRDSLFTGAGYGHFDWYRIVNSFELHDSEGAGRDIVWAEKSKFAIEEYVFARFYMYQNVYLHKTTRGFEKMLEAMWQRARALHRDGTAVDLVPALREFWAAASPSVRQYLAIEEFTVLSQIQAWTSHADKALSDLARRFLHRNRLAMIEAPFPGNDLAPAYAAWEDALAGLVRQAGYDPPEMYCLRDNLKAKYHQPYFPEREADEQSVTNAIRVKVKGASEPVEISELLPRLQPLTQEAADRVRYYIPADLRTEAEKLRSNWK